MNPQTTRTLKAYAYSVIPKQAQEKYEDMVHLFQQWLKKRWNEMNHRERAVFRKIAEYGWPLPDAMKRAARAAGFIVTWPPEPKEKAKPRRYGKKSWKDKRYGMRRL